MYMAKLCS